MRLVDLDEVINAIYSTNWYHLFNGKLSGGAEGEESALYKAEDVYKAIGEVPVVDAIPIEWISNMAKVYEHSDNSILQEGAFLLNILIDDWKAEQEKTVDAVNQKLIEVANASGENWLNGAEQEEQ